MREQFEEKYREMRPDDKSTLMPNGNYSGWVKQACWEGWQMRQANAVQKEAQIFEGASAVTFEEFIKSECPSDYQSMVAKYPTQDVSELFSESYSAWRARQAEVDAKDKWIAELEQWNQNQYQAITDRDLEIQKLNDLICKMLEDKHTYMRPSMAHECIVATGWRNDPE